MRVLVVGFMMLGIAAFIDTMRGPLLPILRAEMMFSHTAGGLFFIASSAGSIAMTLALNPLFERLGERPVALLALALGGLAALSGFAVLSYPGVLLLGLLMGIAAASLGATSNVFVIRGSSPEALGRNLCGLHAMYGGGSALAPALLAATLERGIGWPWALAVLPIVAAAGAVALMPAETGEPPSEEADASRRRPGSVELLILLTVTTYVSGEVLCSLWMTSYLVETVGATPESAAPVLSGFFAVMLGVRLLAFLGLRERLEWPALWGALLVGLLGMGLGLLGWTWGLALAGGMGLYFPVFFARVSRLFPQRWRVLTVWMFAAIQGGLVIMNLAMGRVADLIGISSAYWIPFAALAACGLCTLAYAVVERRALRAV